MKDDVVNKGRGKITRNWRYRGGERPAVPVEEIYVQVAEADQPKPPASQPETRIVGAVDIDTSFSRRMDNWRRTVLSFGGGSGGCCAAWAALYVASKARSGAGDCEEIPRSIVTVDQLDGWLVEGAVRCLIEYDQKMVLRYRFVWQYPEHWIKTKLLLRATGVRLVLARAEMNLQKLLDSLESPTKILSNNLHAGNVPRPESTDAHVGAALTLENDKALIE